MKRLAFIAALVASLFVGPSQAQMNLLTGAGGKFRAGSSAVAFSLAYQSTANDTVGGTTVNYGSLACGAADTNRVVAVGVWTRGAGQITGGTIGGVGATVVTGAGAANGTTTFSNIIYASVPTGTSCAISVTYASATLQSVVWVYRIVTSTPTPTTGQNAASTTLQNISTTTTVPSGGGAINAYGSRNHTVSPTSWTNAVSDNAQIVSGHGVSASTTTGTGSITVTANGFSTNGEVALSSAAWGP